MKFFTILFLSLLVITGCTNSVSNNVLVLPYSEFGPPTMSGKLLGNEWFQWQTHGDSRPRSYPVSVVVYKEISLEKVKDSYPVIESQELDYRYIRYLDALNYLNVNIKDVENMKKEGYPMGNLANDLRSTKTSITNKLAK